MRYALFIGMFWAFATAIMMLFNYGMNRHPTVSDSERFLKRGCEEESPDLAEYTESRVG